MTDINNKLNLNNVHSTYTPSFKKEDDAKCAQNIKQESQIEKNDGSKAADAYGRILVKQPRVDSPETIEGVKQDLEFFMKNPELAAAAVKSADNTYELLCADGVEYAYEKACCGACDAAYNIYFSFY